MNHAGRILCIDYGSVRVGIAVSDLTRTFAQPKEYIKNDGLRLLSIKISELIRQTESSILVIGLPKRLNGSEGRETENIYSLKKIMEEDFSIETVLWDERLSTVSAEKALLESNMSRKKRKEKIDSVAAAIILQNYLDYISNTAK
jgi:putative Holliday junction resolvase